jgi:hypothetical protein
LAFAHLALAAAAIFARAAGLILRLGFPAALAGLDPRTFAQRALCAAAILARALALIILLPEVPPVAPALPPKRLPNSLSKASIWSLIVAARLSCSADRLLNEFIPAN